MTTSKTMAAQAALAEKFSPDVLHNLTKVDPYAVAQLADFDGPSIFNPIIGHTAAETFGNLEKSLAFVSELVAKHHGDLEQIGGFELLVRTCWAATQYESFRAKAAAPTAEAKTAEAPS